jgi:hypothetical protein
LEQELESSALKASISAFVKDKRSASELFAREYLAQNDIVVACLVYRRDPATHLGGGSLQQREPVRAEGNGKIFKSALLISGEASGQIGLMLTENVD